MKYSFISSLFLVGLAGCAGVGPVQSVPPIGQATGGSLTGTVERVWEDGFSINTGDRTVTVDAWDVCGDNTSQAVSVGDQITVAGEFSALEFDASALTNAAGESLCS
jgi:hypothetical protein